MQLARNAASSGVSSAVSSRPSSSSRGCVVVCASRVETPTRRHLLLSAGAVGWGLLQADKAQAVVCSDQSTAEEGDACRQRVLALDERRDFKGDYKSLTGGPAANVSPMGSSAATLNDEYSRATLALAATIDDYLNIDVYDKRRQALIKQLKADSLTWVSKYARGGSVRAQSARNMYVAVDAVLGHLASNGLAPLPPKKVTVVEETMATGLEFLAQSK